MYLGYVRVSTGKQTVENQMFAIEDFCAHQNPPIHIDDWIIETASGMKHFDKRKLGKKLQSVTSDDTIISTEITRLGRSLLMIFSIMAYCLGKGCGIWTIKEGWRLGDNLTSKVLAFAFGLAAEIERALISERTRDALARKRAEGIQLGRPKGALGKHTKLSGKEEVIQTLLDLGNSYASIARALKVDRSTLVRFCDARRIKRSVDCNDLAS